MSDIAILQRRRDLVALEAMSVPSLDVSGLLDKVMPDIKKHFNNFISFFIPSDQPIPMTSDQRKFIELLSKHAFTDLAPLTAFVPEGLDSTYLEYLPYLSSAVDHSSGIMTLINTYTTYLSMLITNHDQRFSTSNSQRVYQGLLEKRKHLLTDMASCFKNGSHDTDTKYSKVVSRNKDWETLLPAADNLSKKMNSVERTVLLKKVKEAEELMDKVIEMLNRGELKGSSNAVAVELSDGAFQIASELELFAIVYYRTLAFVEALKRTQQYVTEILER